MLTISGFGRLGQDPRMQYTAGGTAQTSFSVAANVGFGDNKNTVWVSLVSWGAQAEAFNKYLQKGSRIAFTAEITNVRGYEKKDGTTGVSVDAKVTTLSFVDGLASDEEREPEEF